MKKPKLKKFGLAAIQQVLINTDSNVEMARESLAFAVGAAVEVSGKVQKRVKRSGECKLVIVPGDVPGFVVFADCIADEKAVISRKIRKGSFVSVRGKFQTFGASAVCLSDCRLQN
jgi:hypothetical protein